jgi:hypothetical protein
MPRRFGSDLDVEVLPGMYHDRCRSCVMLSWMCVTGEEEAVNRIPERRTVPACDDSSQTFTHATITYTNIFFFLVFLLSTK